MAYTSTSANSHVSTTDLASILEASDRNNARAGLTGGLLVVGDRFFQVLEGREAPVAQTFDRIRADPRHHNIVEVWSGSSVGRLFERWAMVAVFVDPRERVDIKRVIDQASEYPHAAISALYDLIDYQRGSAR